ncbi:MAG: hypothetical protein ACI8PZ_001889 [Myxococcota bacterium]|jgi:hypothetical protein
MATDVLKLVAEVLRDPQAVVERASDPAEFAVDVPRLLGIGVVGLALFGAIVGSYRGGPQVAFAAVKMPLLLLLPTVVALPAVRSLWAALGAEASWLRLGAAGLVGVARTAVLAAALGPVLWLVYSLGTGYHLSVLLLALALVVVGVPGVSVVGRVLPTAGAEARAAALVSALLLGAITAQTGWLLRPFVARPTASISFLRPVEEDIFSSLFATALSSVGHYPGWDVERKGLLSRPQEER